MVGALGGCLSKPAAPASDDGGLDASPQPNLAFVTSSSYSLSAMTVDTLDAECTRLGQTGNWVAWYSTSAASAVARLGSASGWVRTDGKPFADTPQDIASGRIFYPLVFDEHGTPLEQDTFVATATRGDATYAGNAEDCMAGGSNERFGSADGGIVSWTAGNLDMCTTLYHLYCFEIDHAAHVEPMPPPTSARRAFLLGGAGVLGAVGIGGLDAACASAGRARGISSAIALVATDSKTAKSRLMAGVPYVRPDGVVVIDDQLRRTAPIDVTLDGSYVQAAVWAGATDIGLLGSGDVDTCDDWTNGAVGARTGDSARSLDLAFGGLSNSYNCGVPQQLYCIEQ